MSHDLDQSLDDLIARDSRQRSSNRNNNRNQRYRNGYGRNNYRQDNRDDSYRNHNRNRNHGHNGHNNRHIHHSYDNHRERNRNDRFSRYDSNPNSFGSSNTSDSNRNWRKRRFAEANDPCTDDTPISKRPKVTPRFHNLSNSSNSPNPSNAFNASNTGTAGSNGSDAKMDESVKKRLEKGKYGYATLVMKGDAYIPGALLLGYSIKLTKTKHALIVMVTDDVSEHGRRALSLIYDFVVLVPFVEYSVNQVKHLKTVKQEEKYKAWMCASFTKWNVLQLNHLIKQQYFDSKHVPSNPSNASNASNTSNASTQESKESLESDSVPSKCKQNKQDDHSNNNSNDSSNSSNATDSMDSMDASEKWVDFDRIFFLDSDKVVISNLDEIFTSITACPAGTFSSPWANELMNKRKFNRHHKSSSQRAAAMSDYYARYDLVTNAIVPRDAIDCGLNKNGFVAVGTGMLLQPDMQDYKQFIEMLDKREIADASNRGKLIGFCDCYSMSDEQSIVYYYFSQNKAWRYIDVRYNFIPWKFDWLRQDCAKNLELQRHEDRPKLLHFFGDKPWNQVPSKYGDLQAWWSLAYYLLHYDQICVGKEENRKVLEKYFKQECLSELPVRMDAMDAMDVEMKQRRGGGGREGRGKGQVECFWCKEKVPNACDHYSVSPVTGKCCDVLKGLQ